MLGGNSVAKGIIEPKVLKGFRDQLPQTAIVRQQMLHTIERVFSTFGFAPIDTPALEYAEILLGKGSAETDKQLYRFLDNGERDVALRFDLTVPLARFVAMHINELGTPFKRYHIAPVWRAEKPQRGRYREFIQCDVDIIGTRSELADAEIVATMSQTLAALNIEHKFRINNRMILNGLLQSLGASERSVPVLRAIDKVEKLGREVVAKELAEEANLNAAQVERVFSFVALSAGSRSNAELIKELQSLLKDSEVALSGIAQLNRVLTTLPAYEILESQVAIDLSIARGLDYYTGTVFETTMNEMPQIGSICSGGRYDDLASLYIKRELPGVGASIGLDRILGAFEELGKASSKTSTADILVTLLDEESVFGATQIANSLRKAKIKTELFPEVDKLGNQLKYANKRGILFAVIAGSRELSANVCSVKNLASGEQIDNISIAQVSTKVRTLIPE